MTVHTDDNLVFENFPKQKLTNGDTAYVVIPENIASNHLIWFKTVIGVNSHPEIYHYFTTARLAEAYCNSRNTGQLELNMSDRQITKGLNSVEGVYLAIGTKAFRTNDNGSIISCTIGKGSNPWKYKYFTTRENGKKFLNNELELPAVKEVEIRVETVAEDLSNYDKELILKTYPSMFSEYDENEGHSTFSARQIYLDQLDRIKFKAKDLNIKDLCDIFYLLIIKRYGTSNCDYNRARTADDLYLLAKYEYNIDITFEECYKILCRVIESKKLFSKNFNIGLGWCNTVDRIVTSPNYPKEVTLEDFRKFFNEIKCNRLING